MIRTEDYEDEGEEVQGKFVVDTEDDTAFFNMDLGGSFGKTSSSKNNFGGLKTNWNPGKSPNVTVASASQGGTDPTKCDKNCTACVWSQFCKSAGKGLAALVAGTGSIPMLG